MNRFFRSFLMILSLMIPLAAADVDVDASRKEGPQLRKIFDAFRAGNQPPAGRLQEIGSSLVRMFVPLTDKPYTGWYLLDVVRGDYPNFTYHFDMADNEFVGPLIENGTQVNLGYCYMPKALGDDAWGPPSNYDAWEEFNYQWALHYNSKYGITSFEVWNEPDYNEFFEGSRNDYFEMYKYAVKGIRRAVPAAQVGGPALATNTGWVGPFLDFIIENDLPVNYISYHSQNNGYNDKEYYGRYQDIVDELEQRGMDSVTVHLNEFSYKISPSTGSSYDRSQCAAWFAGTFKHILDNMPRLSRFNKTIIDNAVGDGRWENNGLIDFNGTPKAKFNVFKMYANMPDSAVYLNAEDPLEGLASVKDSTLAVMIWNKTSETETLNLQISELNFILDSVEVFLIDGDHSSFYDNENTAELELFKTVFSSGGTEFNDILAMQPYSIIQYLLRGHRVETAIESKPVITPRSFGLKNYPNPFNNSTQIEFDLPERGPLDIAVFDVQGKKVSELFNGMAQSGLQKITWNGKDSRGSDLASGIYILQISQSGQRMNTRKMMLIR